MSASAFVLHGAASKTALCRCALILLLALPSASCAKLGFYTQAIGGQLEILTKRKSIQALLDEPQTDPKLKAQLAAVLEMRTFASDALALPDNKSYRTYVDLQRPYVVWNVFAAPALSLKPLEWCFAFVGCLNYRGYFSERGAQTFADKLNKKHFDVYVAGVAAYSTLGWFHDPVLNTILDRAETEVAGLIFHELAHQLIYVRDDTTFNESFAVTVEREGVRRWLAQKQADAQFQVYMARQKRRDEFIELVMALRTKLESVYASAFSDDEKHIAKARAFADVLIDYARLKESWNGYSGYDAWFAKKLNNAHLVPVSLYNQYVPAFEALLKKHAGDLTAFYAAVAELGRLSQQERSARLRSLDVSAASPLPLR